ncbi:hypothetical protein [Nocardioides bruguierae]|uniref:Uncharacterized protein n=1 Tax=Nocardioides bruguierae TaxID=2945102 RepID=A0A9X2DAH2_9ACTN|nr:hypothetical protein [Nocardioides bruguierae]MCM0622346.1 hypothetical protein [Nocardioides bruguierae]
MSMSEYLTSLVASIRREPALLLDAVETALVLLVALGVALTDDQTAAITAVIMAAIALLKGWATRPFEVALLVDGARSVLVLVMTFGVGLSPEFIAVATTFVGTFTTLVMRGQISPANGSTTPTSTPTSTVVTDAGHTRPVPAILVAAAVPLVVLFAFLLLQPLLAVLLT